MTSNGINHECEGTPLVVFDMICRSSEETPVISQILATIGWSDNATEIRNHTDKVIFPVSGLMLCGFAINYTDRISTIKLPRFILEQGTECIKHLYEIKITACTELSDSDKVAYIQWYNEFLDIWKSKMEEALQQEDLLIG